MPETAEKSIYEGENEDLFLASGIKRSDLTYVDIKEVRRKIAQKVPLTLTEAFLFRFRFCMGLELHQKLIAKNILEVPDLWGGKRPLLLSGMIKARGGGRRRYHDSFEKIIRDKAPELIQTFECFTQFEIGGCKRNELDLIQAMEAVRDVIDERNRYANNVRTWVKTPGYFREGMVARYRPTVTPDVLKEKADAEWVQVWEPLIGVVEIAPKNFLIFNFLCASTGAALENRPEAFKSGLEYLRKHLAGNAEALLRVDAWEKVITDTSKLSKVSTPRPDFDNSPENVPKSPRGRKLLTHKRLREEFKENPFFREDAASKAKRLRERLVPKIVEEDKKELTDAIIAAQTCAPGNKEAWVDDINTILKAHELRIELADEERCLLAYTPGGNGSGYIMFTKRGGGTRGGFSTAKFKIVEVPSNYMGNRHVTFEPADT